VTGSADVGLLVAGELAAPIVVANADGSDVAFNKIPLRDVHAKLAFYNGTLFLAPALAHASGADLTLRGTLSSGDTAHSEFSLHVSAPADRLPYAGELMGTEPLVADVLLDGRNGIFYAHGALASARGVERAAANFDVQPSGIVTIAPFWVHTERGSVDGAYHIDREKNVSSFWLTAGRLDVRTPVHASFLNASLPKLPPIDARIDRIALEGGGPSGTGAFAAGTIAAHDMRVNGIRIDALDARFGGTIANAAIEPARASGPWGSIAGSGAVTNNALYLRGTYHGNLNGLRPFLANVPAEGLVDGPVALTIEPGRTTIQGDNLILRHATVRGVPISHASGTLAFDGARLHVYNAHVKLAGGDVVAAGVYDTAGMRPGSSLSLVATGLSATELQGLGLPLNSGSVDADGRLASQSPIPRFDGGVSVANGRVQQYDVAGSGIVHLGGNNVALERVVAAIDGTYAFAEGSISALSSGAPAYAVHASVPAGDVARALHTFAIPTYASEGTFNASLDVSGRGLQPAVAGPVNVPAGSVNGLPFVDGAALISADRGGVVARRGAVVVGSTSLSFAAAKSLFISGLHVRSVSAHLADFNNFFDTGDTLHGDGNIAFDVVSQRKRLSSNGRVDVKGFRFRNLTIGDTRANWSSARNVLRGALAVGGESGTLQSHGRIDLAPELDWTRVVRDSRYDIAIDLDSLDLSTWVSALGFPEIPVTGRIDGDSVVAGRYPQLN
ncbi:MAG: hypothetical protein M3N13_05985, partial [Candidatus Eremiobacteraeota bacterium]|nr:hypothetical protein [Candidatus Eremiobacteraeota bacterium]